VQRFAYSSRSIAAHLKCGGLIAYPTESCYGLGCDPSNRRAVKNILKLKQRPQSKGLILLASHYRQLAHYLQEIPLAEQAKLQNTDTQAVTYLMPARPSVPRCLRGKHDTLAVRLTAHSFAKQLCLRTHSALVSTSANLSGQCPARSYAACQRLFGNKVWVLRGRVGKHKQASTIRVWTSGKIMRN